MASRRVRIKGIANIPQRRKPTSTTDESKSEDQNDVDDNKPEIVDLPNLNNASNLHDSTPLVYQEKSDIDLIQDISGTNNNHMQTERNNDANVQSEDPTDASQHKNPKNADVIENKEEQTANNKITNILIPEKMNQSKSVSIRRKFLKPPICVTALNRKLKDIRSEVQVEPNKENVLENVNVNLNEIEISTNNRSPTILIQKSEPQATVLNLGVYILINIFNEMVSLAYCPSTCLTFSEICLLLICFVQKFINNG